ncbi:MAG TPA: tetratricopeptide repeat protein, partial [Planctomycetota bacterium]|nr:tetratricopeptide repeat protein [Planctomycetota bacterium]
MDDPLRRGEERWRSGDLAGAEAAFREALAAGPGAPEPVLGLAGVLADQDRFDAALRVLDRAPAPLDPPAAARLARLRADIFR